MTICADVVDRARVLTDLGWSKAAVSRELGVARSSIRLWLEAGADSVAGKRRAAGRGSCDNGCRLVTSVDRSTYSYLLGMYLGDGTISPGPREVYKLRVTCCKAYPEIMAECRHAMEVVSPANTVGSVNREGCCDLYSYSKHWPCLFPQHGPGRKHERPIVLQPWQAGIVEAHPNELLRGLIQSDGCRVLNRVNGTDYPRYHFSNKSDDIRKIFSDACDRLGIPWRRNNAMNLSVARREAVAFMDTFIGPKK